MGEGDSKTQEDLRTKTRARRNVNDRTLTLAFWQTGSGMQEVRLLDASGLQPPKQNCTGSQSVFGRRWNGEENPRRRNRRSRIHLRHGQRNYGSMRVGLLTAAWRGRAAQRGGVTVDHVEQVQVKN